MGHATWGSGEHEHAGDIAPGVRPPKPGDTLSKLRRPPDYHVSQALNLRRGLRRDPCLPALRDGADPYRGDEAGQGSGL